MPTLPTLPTLREEFEDAVTPRSFGLVLGMMLLQFAFIASFIGAFHAPEPHEIDVALVAPAAAAPSIAAQLDDLDGDPVSMHVVASETEARDLIGRGEMSAALVTDPAGTSDRLLVASGGGASIATAVEGVFGKVAASQQRTVQAEDVVPLQSGDARGLSGFYLVMGWLVGGYLVAALLGIAGGAKPPTRRRVQIRLTSLALYSIVSGLGGALIAGPWLNALEGHVLELWAVGALVVFAAAAATTAFQVILGVSGVGLAVLVFVVMGNPSAGGAYQLELLPALWRGIGNALPNGAATDTVRRIVYFDASGIAGHLVVLAAWAVIGAVVSLVAAHFLHRRRTQPA